jgi:hypothetical protein|tara:strand:+ start:333 stop:602 length:270 start_codon:yes stop_codon:yes gene_type:complete
MTLRSDLEGAVERIRHRDLSDQAIVDEIVNATRNSGDRRFTNGYGNLWLTSGHRNCWATSGRRNYKIVSGHHSISAGVDYIMEQIPKND